MVAVDNNFSLECLEKMIELGCDVNSQNTQDEMTCLHSAYELGLKDVFEMLLRKGANPELQAEGESVYELCKQSKAFSDILKSH